MGKGIEKRGKEEKKKSKKKRVEEFNEKNK